MFHFLRVWEKFHCSHCCILYILLIKQILGWLAWQRPSRFTAKMAGSPPVSCNSAQRHWRPRLGDHFCRATHLLDSDSFNLFKCHGRQLAPNRCTLGGGSVWDVVGATQPWFPAIENISTLLLFVLLPSRSFWLSHVSSWKVVRMQDPFNNKFHLYFVRFVVSMGISPLGNSGRFPQGKPDF